MRTHAAAWLGLALGAVLGGACFNAPRPAVQFSCDPDEAPQCPAGYTCEADGCCHLDGSDYEANVGACQLGGIGGTAGGATGSGTGASTGGETSTGAASSSESGGPSDSGGSDSTATAGTSDSSGSDSSTSDSSGSGT